MGTFAAGQVLIVRFPFSDLSAAKFRPAVVLADASNDDWILCQITSQPYGDSRAIKVETTDFKAGSLRLTSYARPGKLFTCHSSLFGSVAGHLHISKFVEIRGAIIRMLEGK